MAEPAGETRNGAVLYVLVGEVFRKVVLQLTVEAEKEHFLAAAGVTLCLFHCHQRFSRAGRAVDHGGALLVQEIQHGGLLFQQLVEYHMRAVHGNALEQQRIERRNGHERKAAQRQIKKAQIDQQRVA
jgi:hypothetical protein